MGRRAGSIGIRIWAGCRRWSADRGQWGDRSSDTASQQKEENRSRRHGEVHEWAVDFESETRGQGYVEDLVPKLSTRPFNPEFSDTKYCEDDPEPFPLFDRGSNAQNECVDCEASGEQSHQKNGVVQPALTAKSELAHGFDRHCFWPDR